MKLYTAVLILTKEERDEIIGLHSTKSVMDWKYDKDEDLWYTLYGWTQNKKYMHIFKKTRNKKLFRYTTIKDTDQVSFILDRYMDLKIEKYDLEGRTGEKNSVMMTWFEFLTTTDKDFLSSKFILVSNIKYLDPLIFTNGCLRLLEQIGYSDLFFSYFADQLPFHIIPLQDITAAYYKKNFIGIDSRMDAHFNSSSFVTNNHYINELGIPARLVKWNVFNCFIHLFGELLKT